MFVDFIKPGNHEYLVSYHNKLTSQAPPESPPLTPESEWGKRPKNAAMVKERLAKKLQKQQSKKLRDEFEPISVEVKLTSYH